MFSLFGFVLIIKSSSSSYRHWPVVFGYTAPKEPNHTDGEEGEEGFEEGAVDLAIRGLA